MPGANGYGRQNGEVAFGNTEVGRGQRTFAHELLHNLGIVHSTAQTLQHVGWDVGDTLVNMPGYWLANAISTSLKSATFFDVRTPDKLSNEAWISPETYSSLQSSLQFSRTLDSKIDSACVIDILEDPPATTPTAVVDFCILEPDTEDGPYRAYPFPTTRLPWSLQPTPVRASERFTVEFTATTQERERTLFDFVDARVGSDPANPEEDLFVGFIEASVAYPSDLGPLTAIRITDPTGRPVEILDPVLEVFTTTLTNRFLDTDFQIVVTEPPAAGDDVNAPRLITGDAFALAWTIPELGNRSLDYFEYQVYYSHDGGRIWAPLAVNLPGEIRSITVDAAELCTSDDQAEGGEPGIIRVLASDGLNSRYSDIRLSVLGLEADYCLRGTIREDSLLRPDDDESTAG
jgi:hypothetical protein